MSSRWLLLPHALLLCLPHSSPAGNGMITGRVTAPDQTGIQAIVALRESGQSALSGSTGEYRLLGVVPGTYDVKASAVGFQPVTIKGVRVSADETVTLFFQLPAGDITLPEILVAEREHVFERTRTSAKTTFDGDEVKGLPVSGVTELTSMVPGVYGPFIRGAHQYDARVYIDGVDISDRSANWVAERGPFSNATNLQNTMHTAAAATQTFLSPSTYGVAQATVYTGMAGADYGTTSGIITFALKEGRGPWHGTFQFRMSQPGGLRHAGPSVYSDAAAYFSAKDRLLQSAHPQDRTKAGYYTWSPGKYPYGEKPAYAGEFGLGGSLAEWIGVHISGGWFDSHGRLPNEWTRRANVTAKLTFPVSAAIRLNVLGILEDRGQLLGWKNRAYDDWYRFFLEGVPLWDGKTIVGSIKLTHLFSPSAFYDLQVSYSDDSNRRGFCDDNNDAVVSPWESGDYLTWEDSGQVSRYFGGIHSANFDLFFSTADDQTAHHVTDTGLKYMLNHPLFLYEEYSHRTLHVRGVLTDQIAPAHQVSLGGEVRRHWISKIHRSTQLTGVYGIPFFEEVWSRSPLEFSGFLQDRMEYDGLTATIGFRIDGFDFDAADIADYFNPAGDASNAGGVTIGVPVRGENIPVKIFISPRVGISHPVSDRAAVYYSFARTVSPPPYSCMYYNYNSWLWSQATPRIDQEPQVTTTYDLGFQWRVLEGLTGSFGLYYRDMKNYGLAAIKPVVPYMTYGVGVRVCSADSRGAELGVEYRRTEDGIFTGLRARLAYTYSVFNLGRTLYLDQWQYTAAQSSTLGIPGQLPFGDMPFWNRAYGRDYSGKSPMQSGFDRTHRFTFSFSLPLPFTFHLGCTGSFASGFHYPEIYGYDDAPGTTYSWGYREAPWNKRIDLRLEKQFDLPGLCVAGVFVDVINAFNWTNILSYFSFNEATFKAWANNGDPTGGPGVNQPATMEGSLIYGIPREVYFGVSLSF